MMIINVKVSLTTNLQNISGLIYSVFVAADIFSHCLARLPVRLSNKLVSHHVTVKILYVCSLSL